jgi:hypothetical protein
MIDCRWWWVLVWFLCRWIFLIFGTPQGEGDRIKGLQFPSCAVIDSPVVLQGFKITRRWCYRDCCFFWACHRQAYRCGRRFCGIGYDDGLVGNQDTALSALVVGFGIEWFAALVEPTTSATHHLMPDQTTLQNRSTETIARITGTTTTGRSVVGSGCWVRH